MRCTPTQTDLRCTPERLSHQKDFPEHFLVCSASLAERLHKSFSCVQRKSFSCAAQVFLLLHTRKTCAAHHLSRWLRVLLRFVFHCRHEAFSTQDNRRDKTIECWTIEWRYDKLQLKTSTQNVLYSDETPEEKDALRTKMLLIRTGDCVGSCTKTLVSISSFQGKL